MQVGSSIRLRCYCLFLFVITSVAPTLNPSSVRSEASIVHYSGLSHALTRPKFTVLWMMALVAVISLILGGEVKTEALGVVVSPLPREGQISSGEGRRCTRDLHRRLQYAAWPRD